MNAKDIVIKYNNDLNELGRLYKENKDKGYTIILSHNEERGHCMSLVKIDGNLKKMEGNLKVLDTLKEVTFNNENIGQLLEVQFNLMDIFK